MQGSHIIFAERVLAWDVSDVTQITAQNLQPILDADPAIELLLIGTGKTMALLDPDLRQFLRSKNIAAEAMDTGAACRTYNVLLSEERRVAAAVVAI